MGFCSTLTLIFITLKLIDVIDWSWGWVLSPLLFEILIGVITLILYIKADSE